MMVETGSTQKTYVPSKIKKKEITIKCGPRKKFNQNK